MSIRNYKDYFRGKKVTVMGLGLLGRGVGDAKFLAEAGADLIVTDLKTKKELAPSLKKLHNLKTITYHLGKHRLEDFRGRDFILKAAGVPLDSPFITEARKHKVPIKMSASLFAELAPAVKIIGVTGTRGKSTVTHLIYEILKAAGRRVHLGGNVKGISTLALLKKVKAGDSVVLELDSWQLQGFGEAKISPQIAVFTNFMPDHLNYYGSTALTTGQAMKKYYADKANIYKYQKPGDRLIRGKDINHSNILQNMRMKMPGEHNHQNAALAARVAEILKVKPSVIKKVITNFPSLPGRLELVRTVRGVKIYNDTNSTTPEAVLVGLKALGKKKNIILILGGADKNLDFKNVLKIIPKYCKAVILLPGSGTDHLIPKTYHLQPRQVSSLKQALQEAMSLAQSGDTVLFSPGFASFGLFKNEYDRGAKFNARARKLR